MSYQECKRHKKGLKCGFVLKFIGMTPDSKMLGVFLFKEKPTIKSALQKFKRVQETANFKEKKSTTK